MKNTQKHLFLAIITGGFFFGIYFESLALLVIKQLEIAQECDNNRTACEMEAVGNY